MLEQITRENIKNAIAANELNIKTMPGDHIVSEAEREKYIYKRDSQKRKITSKLKRTVADHIANKVTKKINKSTRVVGLENVIEVMDKPGIITSNHYSPVDSLIIRYLTNKIGKKRKLSIVVAESNIFMAGKLGWIIKNINTIPFTPSPRYLEDNFNKTIEQNIKKNHFILFYPEQELWLNYTKPRPLKPGAYHYAAKHGIPVIPTFTVMESVDGNSKYTLFIGKPLYPNKKLDLKENKNLLAEQDFAFKQSVYEQFYNKKLTYEYMESDIIDLVAFPF